MAAIASFVKQYELARRDVESLLDDWAVGTINRILEKDADSLFLGRMRAKVVAGQEKRVLVARCYFKESSTEGPEGPYKSPTDPYSVDMGMDLLVSCYSRAAEANKSNKASGAKFKIACGTPGAMIEFVKVNEWIGGRTVDHFDIYLAMDAVEK